MKKSRFLLLIFLILSACPELFAQSGKVPPFRMILPGGKLFKAQNLPFGKPIILIYFSPDCEDCQKMTSELMDNIDDYLSASIAMITYLSVESVSNFVKKNGLGKFSNIYAGTEGSSLFVKNYYNIEHFPFIVLFNKDGDLIKKYYSNEINLKDLSYRLNRLLIKG